MSDSRSRQATKPNIVYINIDDLGWTDLSCMGSTYYQTPNIDRLASQGMTFTNAYAPASNCAPSRACCITGQYAPRHHVYTVQNSDRGPSHLRKLIPTPNTLSIQEDNLTFGDALKAGGYKTCIVGKWHVSEDPTRNGFDVNIAGCHWGHPHGGYFSPYGNPQLEDGPEGEYLTDRLTTEAIQFVEAHREEPFFLYFPYYIVHTPLQAKEETIEKYRQMEGTEAHNNPEYAAMIEHMDHNIGRLMDTLDTLGLTENTLVLFTSDNGGCYKISKQWPLRAGKGAYYEGGIREPMFVRWPGQIEAGSRCDEPVSGIDYFPTFLEAAGLEPPEEKVLDGKSLMPLLTGAGTLGERPLFWHFPVYLQNGNDETRDPHFRTRPGSVVRLGDWKLHQYFEDGELELYNLADDIGEQVDLAATHPEKAKELHTMLSEWRRELDAPVPTELNPDFGREMVTQ